MLKILFAFCRWSTEGLLLSASLTNCSFACFSDCPAIYLVVCPKALLYFSTAWFAPFCTSSPFVILYCILYVQLNCLSNRPAIQNFSCNPSNIYSLPHCTFVLLCSYGICLLLIFAVFLSLLCIICPIAQLWLTSLPDQYSFVCLPHCTLYVFAHNIC